MQLEVVVHVHVAMNVCETKCDVANYTWTLRGCGNHRFPWVVCMCDLSCRGNHRDSGCICSLALIQYAFVAARNFLLQRSCTAPQPWQSGARRRRSRVVCVPAGRRVCRGLVMFLLRSDTFRAAVQDLRPYGAPLCLPTSSNKQSRSSTQPMRWLRAWRRSLCRCVCIPMSTDCGNYRCLPKVYMH